MQTKINRIDHFWLAGALAVGLTLAACGGDGDAVQNRANDFNGGGPTDPGTPDGPTTVRIGKGSGSDFAQGQIDIGIGDEPLSSGGITTLTVTLVNNDGDLVTDNIDVAFNSPCIAGGKARLEPLAGAAPAEEGAATNTVSSTNGQASIFYRATGCSGSDRVTASASHDGRVLTASATLEIEPDTAQFIRFVDATPAIINMNTPHGSSGVSESEVTFQVMGSGGANASGVPGIEVSFQLTVIGGDGAGVGGASLSTTSTITNDQGLATTRLIAGNQPTTIAVLATAITEDGVSTTQSKGPVISTGFPDQKSMSLAASRINVPSWNTNGVESEITIRMADAFNNPIAGGTPVTFTASGGKIDSSCVATAEAGEPNNSQCTVTWSSQDPRPGSGSPQRFWVEEGTLTLHCPPGMAECRKGRVQVLAYTVGNESFVSETDDGLYHGPPDIFSTGGDCNPNVPVSSASVITITDDLNEVNDLACDDLGSPYLDSNFNGERNAGEFFPGQSQGEPFQSGNGIYNGILCSASAQAQGLCSPDPILVRDNVLILMSCSAPYVMSQQGGGGNRLPGQPTEPVALAAGEVISLQMLLADCNGNSLPGGTEVSVDDSLSQNVEAEARLQRSFTDFTTEPSLVFLVLVASDSDPASGVIFLDVEMPGGIHSFGIPVTSTGVFED